MTQLRGLLAAETSGRSQRLEQLPYFQALHGGSLPRPAIVSYLRCLCIIHSILEAALSQAGDHPVAALARHVPARLPLLTADLAAISADGIPSVTAAIRGALDHGAEVLADADDPFSLAGVLYVLEGSGGAAVRQAYATCLRMDAADLAYLGCQGTDAAGYPKSFGTVWDSLTLDAAQAHVVVDAAKICFDRLESICAALHPYAEHDLKHHVAAINFEAGDHAMPQDPVEIALALRAGRAAWSAYPYLEQRFGDRGRRFTGSDGCWLVTLTRMPVATATKSLEWLRTVLARRGIPTVVLEAHLHAILEALFATFGEQAERRARYAPFLAARDAERDAPECSGLSDLVARFDLRFRGCAGPGVDSAAALIAAAWIDERSGIAGALTALTDWLTDSAHFSPGWIAQVHAMVEELDPARGPPC